MAFLDALRSFFSPSPGFIPEERAIDFATLWGAGNEDAWNAQTATGEAVSVESSLRSIAVQAAIRLLTNDIGSLPVDAYRAQEQGKKELTRPPWVIEPNPGNPNATWEDYIKATVFAMLTDGNAFSYCYPSTSSPTAIRALDPSTVDIHGGAGFGAIEYRVRGISEVLTAQEVLHIPWTVAPGANRGMNPIEAAKQGLGIALAADKFVGSYFGNGAILSGIIEVPAGVTMAPEAIAELKEQFRRKHVGARKSHAVGALTGGASFRPFDYKNRDAQLLELRDQIVEETARLFGIPPHMLGSQKPGAVGYASVEQRSIDYVTHAVLPIVRRIEIAHSRLLRGGQTYLRFNLEGLKRGDQAARSGYYRTMLQNKVMRRDEVRALEELPYDADAVGYLETPNNNSPDQEPTP